MTVDLARGEVRAVEKDLGTKNVRPLRRRGARGKDDTDDLRQDKPEDELQPWDLHTGCYCNSGPALAAPASIRRRQ